jgi:hypothetical protein
MNDGAQLEPGAGHRRGPLGFRRLTGPLPGLLRRRPRARSAPGSLGLVECSVTLDNGVRSNDSSGYRSAVTRPAGCRRRRMRLRTSVICSRAGSRGRPHRRESKGVVGHYGGAQYIGRRPILGRRQMQVQADPSRARRSGYRSAKEDRAPLSLKQANVPGGLHVGRGGSAELYSEPCPVWRAGDDEEPDGTTDPSAAARIAVGLVGRDPIFDGDVEGLVALLNRVWAPAEDRSSVGINPCQPGHHRLVSQVVIRGSVDPRVSV